MRKTVTFSFFAALLVAAALISEPGKARDHEVWLVNLEGSVGPASADMVIRTIEKAGEAGAAAIIIRMDTPGGLDAAMRDIVKAILAARLPVVTWVSASGARAASAGTYIAYASHIVGMAPGTHLGAATPVQMQMPGMPQAQVEELLGAPYLELPRQAPADGKLFVWTDVFWQVDILVDGDGRVVTCRCIPANSAYRRTQSRIASLFQ